MNNNLKCIHIYIQSEKSADSKSDADQIEDIKKRMTTATIKCASDDTKNFIAFTCGIKRKSIPIDATETVLMMAEG